MKLVGRRWTNWSGGVTCKARELVAPRDEVELAAALRCAEGPVRAPGSGHSFAPLCASEGTLVDLSAFTGPRGLDAGARTASFGAATPLWAMGPVLQGHGFALANMGDIDRQTLGGVVGTGTHGTGRSLGSLSAQVTAFRLILANGDVLQCSESENSEIFAAGRVSMGALGVMPEISVRVIPAYKLVERNFALPSGELLEKLDSLVAENRHFEFFWFPYADTAVCKSLNITQGYAQDPATADDLFERGAMERLDMKLFAAINRVLPYTPFLLPAVHRLFSRLMPGPDRVRWSHEAFPSPRTIRFNEMEYAVPIEKGSECLEEIVHTIRKEGINTGFPIEYRTVAGDDIWLSPFYQRDSATIAVHQYHTVDTTRLFTACEKVFRRYEGRPHWGKRHNCGTEEFAALYPQFERFRALRRELDPGAKLLNAYLRGIFT
jgi:FAD-linked oxidoreductase